MPVAVCGSSSSIKHIIGEPPLRDLAREDAEQFVLIDLHSRARHDQQQRTLLPFWVVRGDDRGLGDGGMRDGDVFERDRTDPLAARFDDILGAIDDLGAAVRIDRADVAGPEPTLGIRRAIRAAIEVFAAHPMAAHQKIAERLAIPRQFAAFRVDDLHVRAASGPALL